MKVDAVNEKYHIQQELGRGRFAKVCLAHHKASGLNFAAKFIRRRGSGCDLTSSIEREIAILRSAENIPSIIRIHEDYIGPREATLIIEHCSGGDLYHHIAISGIPFTEPETIIVMRQLLHAIQFLHNQNVVHLDIKPENILLKQAYPQLDIALCDFGFARHLDNKHTLRELIGTPDYVAPEILNYEPITLAADMWSTGCVCYFLLAAISPFWSHTKELTILRVSKVDLQFPSDSPIVNNSTENAKNFIENLLQGIPKHRLTVSEAADNCWLKEEAAIQNTLDDNHSSCKSIIEQLNHEESITNVNNNHNNENVEGNDIVAAVADGVDNDNDDDEEDADDNASDDNQVLPVPMDGIVDDHNLFLPKSSSPIVPPAPVVSISRQENNVKYKRIYSSRFLGTPV